MDNKLLFKHLPTVNNKRLFDCPDCNIKMSAFRCRNKLVFKCYSCDGVWFNKGGFAIFKRTLDHLELHKIQHIYKPPKDDQLNISTCPRCKMPLDDQPYSYKSDVTIRKCSHCLGFWLKIYDFLTLIQNTKMGQELQDDAKVIAKNVSSLMAIKNKVSNEFSLLSVYGRNKKWMFYLTPVALITVLISPIVIITHYLIKKYQDK